MTNNRDFFIRVGNQRFPCTKKQFDDYYRDINAYRRTQQNHGRCVCPQSKRLMCDMDCWTCPYQTNGDISYLDDSLFDEYGHEMTWLDHLQEQLPELQSLSVEDMAADSIDFRGVLERMSEIMPQAIEIGRLRQMGLSDEAIAAELQTPRMTLAYRLNKAAKILKKEFPEFF